MIYDAKVTTPYQDDKQISGMGENVFHNISRNLIFCSVYERQSLAREARKVIHNRGRRRWKIFCHLYREMRHRSAIFAVGNT